MYKSGYTVLLLTIIVSAIGVGLAVNGLFVSNQTSRNAINSTTAQELSSDTRSCTELVLSRLQMYKFYTGDETISLPNSQSCRVLSITRTGNNNRVIQVQVSKDNTTHTLETKIHQINPKLAIDYQRQILSHLDGDAEASSLNANNPYLLDKDALQFWLKADSAKTHLGGRISSLVESSKNSLVLSQSDSSRRPRLAQSNFNLYPTILFDGINDFLTGNNQTMYNNTTGFSLFVVGRSNSTSTSQTYIGKYDEVNNEREWRLQNDDFAVTELATALSPDELANIPNPINTARIITAIWTPNNPVAVRLNGSAAANANQAVSTITNTSEPLIIGAHQQGNSNFLSGEIAEIIIYNRALSLTELNRVETYLNTKYAIF